MNSKLTVTEMKKINSQIARFNKKSTAGEFQFRTAKPSFVFEGDNGEYWVVLAGVADKLRRAGYSEVVA